MYANRLSAYLGKQQNKGEMNKRNAESAKTLRSICHTWRRYKTEKPASRAFNYRCAFNDYKCLEASATEIDLDEELYDSSGFCCDELTSKPSLNVQN